LRISRYFRRHVALTNEHGSWVFLLSPLIIGLAAGRSWSYNSIFLIVALLAGFLIRQPITILVKIYSGRRSPRDLSPALFWIVVYGLIGSIGIVGLIISGFGYLLILIVPGIPVFSWHLYLVSKRAERRQVGVEIVASGVLALSAPAGYWIGIGSPTPMGWVLWLLTWFQSAASIVYAHLRLNQRELDEIPELSTRLRMSLRALVYTTFNLFVVMLFSLKDILPLWLYLPYGLQWLETIWGGLLRPAVKVKPLHIGIRQLIVSSLFTILFIVAWRIG